MTKPKHDHDQTVIPDGVNHTVVAHANSIEVVFPAQLFDASRTWLKPQSLNVSRDAFARFSGKIGELLEC